MWLLRLSRAPKSEVTGQRKIPWRSWKPNGSSGPPMENLGQMGVKIASPKIGYYKHEQHVQYVSWNLEVRPIPKWNPQSSLLHVYILGSNEWNHHEKWANTSHFRIQRWSRFIVDLEIIHLFQTYQLVHWSPMPGTLWPDTWDWSIKSLGIKTQYFTIS